MTDRQSQKNSGQQAPDLLKVSGLRVHFHNAAPERYAVNGVSFSLKKGDTLGIVGESGSGKTVTAMCVSGLMPRGKADEEGSILLDGREMFSCSEEDLRRIRGQDVGVVFQDPMTTFDPLCRIGRQVYMSFPSREMRRSCTAGIRTSFRAACSSGPPSRQP